MKNQPECRPGTYICIDLKSFYASVECAERGLDPFRVNLVVADPDRSKSTICLAITPAMKKLGVKNRCRIHEIPPGIEYITAKPRMRLYIEYSARIYALYLRYIAPEDIHVYSVDECFMDVTHYLSFYGMSASELAVRLMETVREETGICATAGIGSNLYLAKLAMDIIAKHVKDHIGILDERSYRELLWEHQPLTDFWRIGSGTAARLAKYGIFTMGDIAETSLRDEEMLYRLFGTDAELLIDHAWGVENCTMEDIKNYEPQLHSLSNGQVLMRNYSFSEARIVLLEMTELLAMDMTEKELISDSFSVWISYDHRYGLPGSSGSLRLPAPTCSCSMIMHAVGELYDRIADRHVGIRRLGVCAGKVRKEEYEQISLFVNYDLLRRERLLQRAVLEIRRRYGKNAVTRGTALLSCSTYKERNQQIGGHHA